MKLRTRICLLLLLLTPLAVYWQTIFHEFGFRDDYSHLREAREEPGKLVGFTASHGRPVYGALTETTFGLVGDVAHLPWLRLTTVLLLTLLGLALWRQLYQSGWTEVEAAAIGLGITLLPAAQVVTSWAICWPHVLALLLAMAGFSAIETELERGGLKRNVALLGGCLIYALAALIYQSNALFAVVPIAAVLLVRSGREPKNDLIWCAIHLGTLLAGLAVSYLLVKLLFSSGVFHASPRMQIEGNPFTKFGWFLWQPLPNALALFALRDDFNTGAVLFWSAVILVAGLIGYGFKLDAGRGEPARKMKWLLCLVVLPFVAHAVSLAAAERSTAYRALFALSGLVLVLVLFALRGLLAAGRIKPAKHYAILGLLGLGVAILAHRNAYRLIAEPQGREWEMVQRAVQRADFTKAIKAYIITPLVADRATDRVYVDEFGSLSVDSDWVPKEMFKAAVHERFSGDLPAGGSFTFASGRSVPPAQAYDLVIDLRKLKEFRER